MKAGVRSRQQPPRAMARRLVMVLIPIGIIPLREAGRRQHADWTPGATYSLPLPLGAGADCEIDRRQARPSTRNERSCAGIAANPRLIPLLVIRPKERIQRADGWCVEFLVTILRGHQICPAAGRIRRGQDKTRNTSMIDPLKATKGRRMSKKTRKKSPKTALRKGGPRRRRSAKKPPHSEDAERLNGQQSQARKPPNLSAARQHRGAFHKARSTQLARKARPQRPREKRSPTPSSPRAPRHPPSACRATAARRSRCPILRAKNWCCFSIHAPTRPAAPRRPSISPGCRSICQSQTAVLGVSADPPRAQEAFRDKHQSRFLSPPMSSIEMLEAYGVWGEKSMYGRTFQGIFRTTVLIGADGRIIRIWRNVKVDGHADEVLAAAQAPDASGSHSLKINHDEGQIAPAICAVRNSSPTGAGVPMSYRSGQHSEYLQHHPHDHGRTSLAARRGCQHRPSRAHSKTATPSSMPANRSGSGLWRSGSWSAR